MPTTKPKPKTKNEKTPKDKIEHDSLCEEISTLFNGVSLEATENIPHRLLDILDALNLEIPFEGKSINLSNLFRFAINGAKTRAKYIANDKHTSSDARNYRTDLVKITKEAFDGLSALEKLNSRAYDLVNPIASKLPLIVKSIDELS